MPVGCAEPAMRFPDAACRIRGFTVDDPGFVLLA
jgi:hypothetical protein